MSLKERENWLSLSRSNTVFPLVLELINENGSMGIQWRNYIILHWRCVSSLPLRELFNHLFISIWTCFRLWGIVNTTLFIVLLKIFRLAIGNSVSWLLCPFAISLSMCLFCEHFLSLWHYRMLVSSCIFPTSVLESDHSPGSPGSGYERMILETKIQVLGVAHCY